MKIICERCANSDCECVPYDVECDENFKPIDVAKELIGEDNAE